MQVSSKSAGKVEAAYEKLKLLVVTNQLRPNEHLQIAAMAERLAVGVTPLREALIRLAAEDLIVLHPKRGFFAKVATIDELRELYHLAYSLLRSSVSRSAGRLDVERIRLGTVHALDGARGRAGITTSAFAVENLYEQITMMSRNSQMVKIVRNFNDRTHAIRLIRVELFDTAESTTDYVVSLADLLEAEEQEAALARIQRRFDTTVGELHRLIKEVTSRAFSAQWPDPALAPCGFEREYRPDGPAGTPPLPHAHPHASTPGNGKALFGSAGR